MSHAEIITSIREKMGDRLSIFGHHYQTDEVIRHTDQQGDSLELARRIPGLESEYIVFCGVYFMAETAAILSKPGQKTLIPDVEASCFMSEMAPATYVRTIVEKLAADGRKIIPLAYVNSQAAVKAVCGEYGGSVCTSANAEIMLRWAMDQGDGVLFLPDKNLANNTANLIGIPESKRYEAVITSLGDNMDENAARDADLIIWPGLCVIHHRFKVSHIEAFRKSHPGAPVIVHPECSPEVVQAADANGSTSKIIAFVEAQPEGSTIIIGTEINLVNRLAHKYRGTKTILPLLESACSNMGRITEEKLAATLSDIQNQQPVEVPASIQEPALVALERMLKACS